MSLAPLALFTYRRPGHTRRALLTLSACPEFKDSQLFVFSDGPKDASVAQDVADVRLLLRSLDHPRLEVIEAPVNQGLAASIVAGVTRLCQSHGKVIVVEDDLVMAPTFLTFMNEALERYAGEERVMQVAGNSFVPGHLALDHAVFLPFISSWGWATWQRAWRAPGDGHQDRERLRHDPRALGAFNLDWHFDYFRMLTRQCRGRSDSWAILWYLEVFKRGGLVLYPPRALVRNEGFGRAATHTRHSRPPEEAGATAWDDGHAGEGVIGMPARIEVDPLVYREVGRVMHRWMSRRRRLLLAAERLVCTLASTLRHPSSPAETA